MLLHHKNIFTQQASSEEVLTLLKELVKEATIGKSYYYNIKLGGLNKYAELKKKDNTFKKELVSICMEYFQKSKAQNFYRDDEWHTCTSLLSLLLRSDIGFSEGEMLILLQNSAIRGNVEYWFPVNAALSNLERVVKKSGVLSEELKNFLQDYAGISMPYGEDAKASLKIKEILAIAAGKSVGEIAPVILDDTDAFGKMINQFAEKLSPEKQILYYNLFAILKKTASGKPSQKFYKETSALIEQIGKEDFTIVFKEWMTFLQKTDAKKETNEYDNSNYTYSYYTYLLETNQTFIKGLIWAILPFVDNSILAAIANYGEKCFKKIPGKGPLAAGIGNACIYILANTSLEGVAFLSRLRLRIKQNNTQDLIEKYIREASEKLGVSPAEIEDMAVPNYGLEVGEVDFEVEDYKVFIKIKAIGKTELTWYKADGTALKSEPSALKQNHKEELKIIKDTATQIQKMLSAQRDRLERGFVEGRILSYQQFLDYYFNHRLMIYLTKQLIWTFEINNQKFDVFYWDNNWIDVNGHSITNINQAQTAKVWHPIHYKPDEILAWRNFLGEREIRQPIKQAYREIYLLTDAEINTRTYSNRMAAHLLKQSQFNALAKVRGWRYSLLGAYDKGYNSETAKLELPNDWMAEYWVQEVYADGAWNDAGIYSYISTDQVRFYLKGVQMNMVDVPPLLFSEAMRDVDLFVGVASVGNDPNWRDGGLQNYRTYWETYSFGDLSEVAKTRKQVLEKIVPRLKIAKQCEIRDKFLFVKGTIKTYKIHIGSGNILMEPNDQYLCIVPDRKTETLGDKVFLPFEGDNVLSIILSKAFFLADDIKITDSTILSQLK